MPSERGVLVGSTLISIVGVGVRVGLGVRVGFGVAVDPELGVIPPAQAANKSNPAMFIIIQVRGDFFMADLPGGSFHIIRQLEISVILDKFVSVREI